MERYQLRIKEIKEEAEGVKTYYFEKPEEMNWQEGAHTHVGLLGYDAGELPNKAWIRHLSIMTLPQENKIGFTTKVPGSNSEFKRKLSELQVGDELVFFKIGSRMQLRRLDRPIVLLSMGVGLATLRPVIFAYHQDNTGIPGLTNVTINSSGGFLYRKELEELEEDTYRNYWLKTRESYYELLKELSGVNGLYYVVGNDDFMKETIRFLQNQGVSAEDIHIDRKEEKRQGYFEA